MKNLEGYSQSNEFAAKMTINSRYTGKGWVEVGSIDHRTINTENPRSNPTLFSPK